MNNIEVEVIMNIKDIEVIVEKTQYDLEVELPVRNIEVIVEK